MKVKELIEKLSKLDPELRVVTINKQRGFNDISSLEEVELALFVNDKWYDGQHEMSDLVDHYEKQYDLENSLIIN